MGIATYVLSLIFVCTLPGTLGKLQNVTATAGEEITLKTGITGLQGDYEVLWYLVPSEETLVHCDNGQILVEPPKRFEGNLHLDTKTGCLKIPHITESGVYQGEITDENNNKTTVTYNIIVSEAAGSSLNTAAVLKAPLAFVVAAVCILLLI